jgi:hypothetical protein
VDGRPPTRQAPPPDRSWPSGDAPGVSKLVQVRFLNLVHRSATMTVPLRWEVTGAAGGLFPVLDADLTQSDGLDRRRPRR